MKKSKNSRCRIIRGRRVCPKRKRGLRGSSTQHARHRKIWEHEGFSLLADTVKLLRRDPAAFFKSYGTKACPVLQETLRASDRHAAMASAEAQWTIEPWENPDVPWSAMGKKPPTQDEFYDRWNRYARELRALTHLYCSNPSSASREEVERFKAEGRW